MTDTTHEAPERIWVQHRTCTVDASGAARILAMDRPFSAAAEYVRADLVQAANRLAEYLNGNPIYMERVHHLAALIRKGGK